MKKNVWILLFTGALSGACVKTEDHNEVAVKAFVQAKVEERLENYRRILEKNCIEKALTEAGNLADSILITRARLQRDTLSKPPKPEKPEKPEIRRPKEDIPLAPLFKDSIKNR